MAILNDIYSSLGIKQPRSLASTNPYAGSQQLNVPGLGNFSPAQVTNWVNTHSPTELGSVVNQYGIDPAALTATYNTGAGTNISLNDAYNYLGMPQPSSFNIPTDLHPGSSSSSSSSGHTGINWESPAAATALPYLQQATEDLPGYVQSIPGLLTSQYSNLMDEAMGPNAFQGTLNNLASRNVLNSSIASDAMARLANSIAQNIGNQSYLAQLQGVNAQMNLPNLLGQIATLGQESTSRSGGSSSNSNPLAPYTLMAQMLE